MISWNLPIPKATPQLAAIAGRAVGNRVKAHLREKNASEPNKLGGKRTNFWADVARSVSNPVPRGPLTTTITISHPAIYQKLFGGTITPKNGPKYLTIPACAAAYGTRARSWKLRYVQFGRGANAKRALVMADDAKPKRFKTQRRPGAGVETFKQTATAKKGAVMFWLVAKAYQKPTPNTLPSVEDLERAAHEAIAAFLKKP